MMNVLFANRKMRLAAAGLFISALALLASCSFESPQPPRSGYARKIAYYSDIIRKHPEHFPAHASLAAAYLEKMRETGDPSDLAMARKEVKRSIQIQPNYQAFKVFANIQGFSHRFAESIEWADKAAASAADIGPDPETASILVDGYLGLGETDKAKAVIDNLRDEGFYTSAARGHYFKAVGKNAEAADEFQKAANFALAQKSAPAQAWADAMTAGVWIDAGEPDRALAYIKKAERIAPESKAVKIHRAEYLVLKGDPEGALKVYSSILERSEDGEIHRRMFDLLIELGRKDEAQSHFKQAEVIFKKAIDAREIYTLGPYAQMLCDAGVRLDEARKLSEENLKYKRDAAAMKTDKCVSGRS